MDLQATTPLHRGPIERRVDFKWVGVPGHQGIFDRIAVLHPGCEDLAAVGADGELDFTHGVGTWGGGSSQQQRRWQQAALALSCLKFRKCAYGHYGRSQTQSTTAAFFLNGAQVDLKGEVGRMMAITTAQDVARLTQRLGKHFPAITFPPRASTGVTLGRI